MAGMIRGTPDAPAPVGLVPAAGFARRLQPLPCSKEILPLGYEASAGNDDARPILACDSLLSAFAVAGVRRAFVVTRPEKWDIPTYLGNGKDYGLDLAYVFTSPTDGVPITVSAACSQLDGSSVVAFGFPDIVFRPSDTFVHLLSRAESTGADLVLGLFPAGDAGRQDTVGIDARGRVDELRIREAGSSLPWTWIVAVWTPAFTGVLTRVVAERMEESGSGRRGWRRELRMGHVIRAAMHEGLHVEGLPISDGWSLDVGTREDLDHILRSMIPGDLVAPAARRRPSPERGRER